MDGKPFKVGRFAHSLRVRLMREHIGIDVDALDDQDLRVHGTSEAGHTRDVWDPDAEQRNGQETVTEKTHHAERAQNKMLGAKDVIRQGDSDIVYLNFDYLLIEDSTVLHGSKVVGTKEVTQGFHATGLERGGSDATLREGTSNYIREGEEAPSSAETLLPIFEGKVVAEFQPPAGRTHGMSIEKNASIDAPERVGDALADANVENGPLLDLFEDESTTSETYYQPSDAPSKYLNAKPGQSPWTVPTPRPKYDADSFEDPICDRFWKGIWAACAERNVGVFFSRFPRS